MVALGRIVAGLIGVGFVWVSFGPMAFDPEAIDWVMISDRGQAFIGWHLYRNAPWSFPLGQIPSYVTPIGASLANCDSIPLFSLLLRAVSPLLPSTFQPIGLWYALCYFAIGFTSFWLLNELIDDPVVSLCASTLVVINPVLLFRRFHPSLCAQWLLLAAFLGYLRSSGRCPRRHFVSFWAGLLVVSSGIHPYLAAMVLVVSAASLARRTREGVAVSSTFVDGLVLSAAVSAGLLLFGELTIAPVAPGFGGYSANLLTLVDPDGWSRVLPDLPGAEGQYEGFAYLGLGCFIALGLAFVLWMARGRDTARSQIVHVPPLTPLVLATLLLAIFSLSSQIRLGHRVLLNLDRLYAWIDPLPSIFRASGRFIWPLYYLVLVGSLAILARAIGRRWLTTAVIASAVIAQIADGWAAYSTQSVDLMALTNPVPRLRSECWRNLGQSYDEILLFPPGIVDAPCGDGAWPRFTYLPFAYLAGREKMAINSGHLSRPPLADVARLCRDFEREVSTGAVRGRSVYVVADEALPRFAPYWRRNAVCGRIDGFWACAAADRATRLRRCLDRPETDAERGPSDRPSPTGLRENRSGARSCSGTARPREPRRPGPTGRPSRS